MDTLKGGHFRFDFKERLKGRSQIKAVFNKGRRVSCPGARLFALKNNLPHNRICFTFPRGFGGAVSRNRARRLGREAYRLLKPETQPLCDGYDLILLVYPEENATLSLRVQQMQRLFAKVGLIK
ncbi:MAG: ribonuclease P protein component [Spirochaetes bacterium]|nr:ribonuclease P protein component [Spirochaetota bacterium]